MKTEIYAAPVVKGLIWYFVSFSLLLTCHLPLQFRRRREWKFSYIIKFIYETKVFDVIFVADYTTFLFLFRFCCVIHDCTVNSKMYYDTCIDVLSLK